MTGNLVKHLLGTTRVKVMLRTGYLPN
ncbi:uncharacterized protein METZ01_LOCUS364573 [marine metagenome]|uniref:Uncharacterized protein n=1 Tax=marine metagenome TaxID=408172 RepID=A0A382SP91_9ZZZZ